jgi:hypothetical protein
MRYFVIPRPINRQRPFVMPHANGIAYTAERELAALDRYEAQNLAAVLGAGDPVPETDVDEVLGGPAAPVDHVMSRHQQQQQPQPDPLPAEPCDVDMTGTAQAPVALLERLLSEMQTVVTVMSRLADALDRRTAAEDILRQRRERETERKRRWRALQKYNTTRV